MNNRMFATRAALLALLALGLSACNDGDVSAPPVVQVEQPDVVCNPIDLQTTSPSGARTCTWSITREGAAGEVIPNQLCNEADDCPGTFFCAADTQQWTAQSQICPNNVANASPDPIGAAAIYVASNDGLPNELRRLTRAAPVASEPNPAYVLDEMFLHNSRENQGTAVDNSGNLLHVGDGLGQGVDTDNTPGLITACQIDIRGVAGMGDAYDGELDHQLRGANAGFPPEFENNPGMASPKGMLISQERGLAFVADVGNSTVRAYGLAAGGNNNPVATVSTPGNPWDLAYDAGNDVMYVALTSGAIARYNNAGSIMRGGGTPPLTGLIGIEDESGTLIASNLHGIEHVPGSDGAIDALVVSDVGPATTMDDGATFNSDGALYLIRGIFETSNGNVVPDRIVRGASTQLGNPVDLVVSGRDLVVAEKANDMVLFFNDFFSEEGENVAPTQSLAIVKPESLALQQVFGVQRPAVSDFPRTTPAISKLYVSRAVDGTITIERRDVSGALEFEYELEGDGLTSQNVLAGLNGEALVTTLDTSDMMGNEGGVLNINAFATRTVNASFAATRDRRHSGNGLTGPRGFDIAPELGLLFVADFGAGNIKVLSACGDGTVLDTLNVAAVSHNDLGIAPSPDPDAAPWDVDFDPDTGDLYVAMVNGNLAVFRNVAGGEGSTVGDGDASNNDYDFTVDFQLIVDNAAIAIGDNLHGVEFVPSAGAGGGSLILSDVGAATTAAQPGFDTDGALYVVNNVGSLGTNGQMQQTRIVDARIAGPNSLLGNPVDIAFDGANVYVAEKANAGGQILRFNNILSVTGDRDSAPSAPPVTAAAVESISVVPDYIINP